VFEFLPKKSLEISSRLVGFQPRFSILWLFGFRKRGRMYYFLQLHFAVVSGL
jgi:hypothetical protein